jgi:GT2 family glycosyltransferase
MMQDRYGRWARGFDLAYDGQVYQPLGEAPALEPPLSKPSKRLKIAIYGRQHTARRCVDLALMGLELLAQQRDDFEVHFFGQEEMSFNAAPFSAYNHGVLNDVQLAQLYNECDLGLCFSATNYSLVPQEMMACGLPVVELETDSTRAVFPEATVALVGPDPQAIAADLAALIDDPNQRIAQHAAALAWVSGFDWQRSARAVETALLEYLNEHTTVIPAPTVIAARDPALEIFIPTFNGLGEVEQVIGALRSQRLADQMQIHCIDSSSEDGTTEWLKAQPDIALNVIEQSEFQHGRTRNALAAEGRAPVMAFLTQDAAPVGAHWATDILKMMRHYPDAAGLFGRHVPHPHHSLRVRQDINQHFEDMLHHPLAVSRDTDRVRWQSGDLPWRQVLHYFSDNNAALRRAVWQDIPYPEVDYGEDQLWARTIIEAGHTKLYAPTAVVRHSHDFSAEKAYARSKTEAAFFYTHFGYEMGEGSDEEVAARIAVAQDALVTWARRHRVTEDTLAREQEITAHRYRGWRDGRLEAQQAAGIV